jgi:predicted DNA-binding transcriptional regulator AlpA
LLPLAAAALIAIARTMAGAVPQRRAEADAALAASLRAWREGQDSPSGWSPDGAGLMSRREIGEFFRLGKSAAYDLTRRADFPPPVVVSTRCLRWPQRDVTQFAERLRGNPPRRRGHPRAAHHPAGAPAGQRRITGRVRAVGERRETR